MRCMEKPHTRLARKATDRNGAVPARAFKPGAGALLSGCPDGGEPCAAESACPPILVKSAAASAKTPVIVRAHLGVREINGSRIETIIQPGRRCLVPADNFYEWSLVDGQPFAVALADRQVMTLAG